MSYVEPLEARRLFSTWYVALNGSDSNNGRTLRHPFATIQRAADVAQAGDTVFIHGGTYRETVVPAHSGTAKKPILFRPLNNQKVTIDGADPVGGWSPSADNIFQTSAMNWDLGDGNNQLFANNQMVQEARWPSSPTSISDLWNPTFATISDVSVQSLGNGMMSATIDVPELTDAAGAWVGATIHFAPGQEWVFQTGTVTASSPGSLTFSYQQLDDPANETPIVGNRFYLTGNVAALDSSGEWFRDPNTGILSFDSSGAPTNVEAKHRLYSFDLSGRSYIDVTGINLFACTINTDSASSHILLDSINAQYVSHQMDIADPWADKFHPHTTGIILNGSYNTIQNSTIRYSSGDGVFLGGSNNTVQNTTISDTNYSLSNDAAVSTLGTSERVTQNTITNTGRDGVSIYYSQVEVDHNRISNCALLTTDAGGVYTFATDGAGSQIDHNLVSGAHSGGFGAAAIYLDNGSSSYIVHHNVCWNVDYALKLNSPSTSNQVYNNTLLGAQGSIASGGDMSMPGCSFANNILGGPSRVGPGATESNDLPYSPAIAFVNPAAGNFTLSRSSIAIDKGTVTPYTGKYVGAAPDVGSYEFGGKPFTVGVGKRLKSRG